MTTRTSDGDVTHVSGTVTYTYKVAGDTISYTNGRTQSMSEAGWDIDYTETGDCSGDDLTLKGRIESGGDFVSTWTHELTRE